MIHADRCIVSALLRVIDRGHLRFEAYIGFARDLLRGPFERVAFLKPSRVARKDVHAFVIRNEAMAQPSARCGRLGCSAADASAFALNPGVDLGRTRQNRVLPPSLIGCGNGNTGHASCDAATYRC